MSDKADSIVARIVAAPHERLSVDDVTVLTGLQNRTPMMDKLLAVHFFLEQQFDRALPHAAAVFRAEPSSETAMNVADILRCAGRVTDAIAFVDTDGEMIEPLTRAELLCMMFTAVGDFARARSYGTEALRIKDAQATPAHELNPVVQAFNPERPQRNVIVFSLWGQTDRYLEGAINNATIARYLYPGWTVRIYSDQSVPQPLRQELKYAGADLRVPPQSWPAASHGLFWRFLVEDDPEVDIYIVRDADSVMNIKERAAVEDWLTSGRAFHVMRDYPSHCELILAGMWGAHRGNIGDMQGRVEAYIAGAPKRLNDATADQEFLRRQIWPTVRQDALVHDEVFDFGETSPYPSGFRLPRNRHIGQNDWVHRQPQRGA
ncbi:MAG: hypothetical protein AAF409_14725 [Pseudomonadota bacterium]